MRSPSLLFLFSFSLLFSDNYYADTTGTDNSFCSQSDPCEHIQTAINLTSDGDVVIVSGGTYLENLLIETGITLKSADGIDPAIIDGSSPETDLALWNGGSCIVIRTPSGASSRVTATVQDIIMTGGKGTDIIEDSNHNGSFSDPEDEIKKVGGGMIVHKAGLLSRGNKIINNGDSSTKEGGAVYAAGTGVDIPDPQPADPPDDHFPNERLLIEFEETIFSDNDAQFGNTVMVNGWNPENQFIDMDFGNSQFDVVFDSDNNDLDFVSEYWVKGKDNSTFDFTGGITGGYDAIITDVWVDPTNGVNEENLVGDEPSPFLTIDYAMSMIYPTEDNPITIYLIGGTYSLSNNGETYPINLPPYTNLIGHSETAEGVILDAGGAASAIYSNFGVEPYDNVISNLTITGQGQTGGDYWGGSAINFQSYSYDTDSYILLDRILIYNNQGHAINLHGPNAVLSNLTIVNNERMGLVSWGQNNIYIYNSIFWNNLLGQWSDGFNIFSEDSNSSIFVNNSLIDPTEEELGFCLQDDWICGQIDCTLGDSVCYEFNNSGSPEEWEESQWMCEDYGESLNLQEFCMWFDEEGCMPAANLYPPCDEGDCYDNSIEFCGENAIGTDGWCCQFNILQNIVTIEYNDYSISENPQFATELYDLSEDSPCIDTGTEILEYNGEIIVDIPGSEYCGIAPDMGAYEYITEDCEESTLSGDLNSDGMLNVLDVVVLVNIVLGYGEIIDAGDMNGDGLLNVLDVVALVSIILEG